jgi:hypothetical protein
MIHERYRRDYDGEFVLVEVTLRDNQIRQQREWIDNPVENSHISGRAAVIAERFAYGKFSHCRLQDHRGGLLATKSLQTYGTGDLWQDMRFDFFLTDQARVAQDIIEKKYHEQSVIYSTTRLCLQNPGCFYPVPYQPPIDVLAQIAYLAAFDGHREIFLLGYRGDLAAGTAAWISDVDRVIKTYPGSRFYIVDTANTPGAWFDNDNVESMTLRRFISYCDV